MQQSADLLHTLVTGSTERLAPLVAGLTVLGGTLVRRRRDIDNTKMVAIVSLALQGVVLPTVVVVAASFAASVRWAPYAYAFINPIAGSNRDGQSWEPDYWGVSAREGVTRLREEGLTSIQVRPAPQVGSPYGGQSPTDTFDEKTGLYVFYRWDTRAANFGCAVIFTITRDGRVLGEGARCPATSPQ